mmetsp:Transcript_97377/g.275527  ORF Transcript_97377/g.275527 Transcript_97377/m.275527 type:complete len:276 (+) Transcript_97377:1019-1846(+)
MLTRTSLDAMTMYVFWISWHEGVSSRYFRARHLCIIPLRPASPLNSSQCSSMSTSQIMDLTGSRSTRLSRAAAFLRTSARHSELATISPWLIRHVVTSPRLEKSLASAMNIALRHRFSASFLQCVDMAWSRWNSLCCSFWMRATTLAHAAGKSSSSLCSPRQVHILPSPGVWSLHSFSIGTLHTRIASVSALMFAVRVDWILNSDSAHRFERLGLCSSRQSWRRPPPGCTSWQYSSTSPTQSLYVLGANRMSLMPCETKRSISSLQPLSSMFSSA